MSKGGLSSRSKIRYGGLVPGARPVVKRVPVNKTKAQREREKLRNNEHLAGLNFVQRELLDIDMPDAFDDIIDLGGNADDDWEDMPLPPGEEATYMSHAGGETTLHQVMEGAWPGRGDPRTRSMRVQSQIDSWNEQMPLLVDAYLRYKNAGGPPVKNDIIAWPLTVIGFNESGLRSFSHPGDVRKANETLLRHGYLGSSPDKPSIAFSLRTLEIYRQIHRVCPRFTIDSLAKTLNHLHRVDKFKDEVRDSTKVSMATPTSLAAFTETLAAPLAPTPHPITASSPAPASLAPTADVASASSSSLPSSALPASAPGMASHMSPSVNNDSVNTVDGSLDPDAADDDIAWLNINELSAEETDELTRMRHATWNRFRAEPPEVAKTVDYMELLAKLDVAVAASEDAAKDWKNLDYLITVQGITAPQIKIIRTRYRTTFTRVTLINEELIRFEEEHGYEHRWTSKDKDYQDAVLLMAERRYRRALDELERLVVQRLMEMTKLSMSGVAYKLRDKIGKALKTRTNAIHRAVNAYNAAATVLNPPRNPLSFIEVLQTASLAEFDILRDTRNDIRKLPWTNPARREAASLYFGIQRAKEEIIRLNVEISRLLTFMFDEHIDYYQAIQDTYLINPDLAHELSDRWVYRSRINESIIDRLIKTSRLPGFSGHLFPGQRVGREPSLNLRYPLPPWAAGTLGLVQVVVEHEEDNDAVDAPRELEGVDEDILIHFMENLDVNIPEE
ncbi:hypothetical protein MVEN_01013300 [Mycena venus]|uniref:Uncharacterized protein n=1 Tax=Mycena venus TaxID=2733690 RepID=A0A8H6YEY5_9AGAR|nr:hypothetical protein MVEN_01013300 [Mycena venus]